MNRAANLNASPSWRYDIISERRYQPELGEYHTYGVQIATPGHTGAMRDISACKKKVESIVELLNQHQASPIHLRDIIVDMLP